MRFTTAALAVAALASTTRSDTTAFQIQSPVVAGLVTRRRSTSSTSNINISYYRQGICNNTNKNKSWLARRNGSIFSTPTTTVVQPQDASQSLASLSNPLVLEPGDDGIYHLTTPEEHAALLQTMGKDKLVILKVFAPWCRACKGLEPKFLKMSTEPEYNENVPIVWASLSIQNNKAFVQSLGVLALPTVQFYVRGKIVDTFPCGPSKVPIFRQKLTALVHDNVDRTTGTLQKHTTNMAESVYKAEEAANRVKLDATSGSTTKSASATDDETATAAPSPKLSPEERRRLEETVPYFQSLSLADKDQVLDQAVFMKFEPGSILMREGRMGRTFYVIATGAVEICQKMNRRGGGGGDAYFMSDPLVQPAAAPLWEEDDGYLGSVVNRLGPGDYFGERALITGEPRAASLRVGTEPVTLWAFDQDVFPASCVLSGKTKNAIRRGEKEDKVDLDEKYGVVMDEEEEDHLSDVLLSKQMRDSATASQVRGSVFARQPLDDEDDEGEDVDEVVDADFLSSTTSAASTSAGMVSWTNEDAIFSVLTRFQMIRHVSTCFQYIQKTRAVWGDAGSRNRRGLLANRLSPAQKAEFKEIFQLIDSNGDGHIELKELKRVMETIGEDDVVLRKVLQKKGDVAVEANGSSSPGPYSAKMTYQDFLGLMAEATFYHLFLDIFSSLDDQGSGFVRAQELDRVLCGVRDLISDDRKSVIDVEDKDMLIDYEQFARMLLGTTLI